MMRVYRLNMFFCMAVLLLLLLSCEQDGNLKQALKLAGDNRPELEKVLKHYADDSLKLKAAKFLIKNMIVHYSYAEEKGLSSYYGEIDSLYDVSGQLPYDRRVQLYDSISAKYNRPAIFEKIPDIKIVSAQFLIDNIDRSFDLWQNGSWATHLGFDDFCEYILPYKIIEGQTLDNWKEYAYDICSDNLDSLYYCDTYKNLAYKACEEVNLQLKNKLKLYPIIVNRTNSDIPIRKVDVSMKILKSICDDYAFIATAVMRAKGIPVAMDYTPQWPHRSLGHSWNVLLDNFGKNTIFMGCDNIPGMPHNVDHKIAKVFRKTYAINKELEEIYRKEKTIPPSFNNFCAKDVTHEYMKAHDVRIEIKGKTSHGYAYLAVFDNQNWVPIHWGKIKKNQVIFERMGANICYLPVCYNDGLTTPVAPPFILTYAGEKIALIPHKDKRQTLKLYRKYYYPEHVLYCCKRLIGAKIQASNFKDFRDSITLFTIREAGTHTGKVDFNAYTEKYRYWRYLSPDGGYCNIAELYFFEKGKREPVYSDIIGTEGSYENMGDVKENVFDKDPLTAFVAHLPSGAWVGMDFGYPVEIEKILYIPRADGNSIVYGDEYELMYWDNEWISLGRKVADSNLLEYDNCPENALFLLHNHTTGKEERIFTYKNDKQIWW